MGSGFLKKKKEARALQEQLTQMRTQIDSMEIEGVAGNGLVTITLMGDNTMKQIKIKPECIDPEDAEGLQDLIRTAYQDAKKKLDAQSMQGMPPGFKGMF